VALKRRKFAILESFKPIIKRKKKGRDSMSARNKVSQQRHWDRWYQSGALGLTAVDEAVKLVSKQLSKLGIVVVDAHTYPSTRKFGEPYSIVIITGYIPSLACIFVVEFNFGVFDDYKFTVLGQVADGKWEKIQGDGGHHFQELSRNSVSSESYGGGTFSINTYTSYGGCLGRTTKEKVEYGVFFFKRFLAGYRDAVAKTFSETIFLWFVPEYSDELIALEEKNGKHARTNYIGFNKRVMNCFPKGFFCPDQRP